MLEELRHYAVGACARDCATVLCCCRASLLNFLCRRVVLWSRKLILRICRASRHNSLLCRRRSWLSSTKSSGGGWVMGVAMAVPSGSQASTKRKRSQGSSHVIAYLFWTIVL